MTDYLEKTAEAQFHLCSVAKDCVVLSQGDETRANRLLAGALWESEEFKLLPKFRQTFVVGFVAGLLANQMSPTTVLPDIGKPVPEREEAPRGVRNLQPGATWHRHENGGGWVSETAYVEATALVGAKAVVFDHARVLDRAKIYGAAKISGDAECFGSCHVHGLAIVQGQAKVFDAARVLGRVMLTGNVQVGGMSLVRGSETIASGLIMDERLAPAQIKRNSYVGEIKGLRRTREA